MRCVTCGQEKPLTNFQVTSIGRKPMCRLCCYGKVTERKPPARRSPPRPSDRRPTLPLKPVFVPLNSEGRRIGEQHPRAKLLDSEVDLVFALRESGMSYAQVAQTMGISKSAAAHICKGRRRCQTPERWVQITPPSQKARRAPQDRPKPKAKKKPELSRATPEGVVELQSALRTWR